MFADDDDGVPRLSAGSALLRAAGAADAAAIQRILGSGELSAREVAEKAPRLMLAALLATPLHLASAADAAEVATHRHRGSAPGAVQLEDAEAGRPLSPPHRQPLWQVRDNRAPIDEPAAATALQAVIAGGVSVHTRVQLQLPHLGSRAPAAITVAASHHLPQRLQVLLAEGADVAADVVVTLDASTDGRDSLPLQRALFASLNWITTNRRGFQRQYRDTRDAVLASLQPPPHHACGDGAVTAAPSSEACETVAGFPWPLLVTGEVGDWAPGGWFTGWPHGEARVALQWLAQVRRKPCACLTRLCVHVVIQNLTSSSRWCRVASLRMWRRCCR